MLRILLTVSISAIVLSSVSGWLVYVNSEKAVLRIQEEASAKVLTQVNFNIDYMHEMVRTLAVSLFFDPESVYLLHSREMDIGDFYQKMMRTEKVANTTSFLDSILIYNRYTNCYYSTHIKRSCTDDGVQGMVDRYLQNHDRVIPRLTLIPLSAEEPENGVAHIDLLAYAMYDRNINIADADASKLILNIKPEWLFENINSINVLNEQTGGTFIMDRNSVSFHLTKELPFDMTEVAAEIRMHRDQSNLPLDTFVISNGEKKWVATYQDSEINNWLIVSVQDYDKVFAETQKMKTVAIAILLGCVVLAMLASLVASILLYRPMNRMLAQIGGGPVDRESLSVAGDEFSYISDKYLRVLEGMNQLKKEKEESYGDFKTFVMRRLLIDSASVSLQELEGVAETGKLNVDVSKPMLLVLFQLDVFGRIDHRTTQSEKRLYKFAIGNIAGEMIAKHFANEAVDMRNDHLAILLNTADNRTEETLVPLLRDIQNLILQYYEISFTVSVSDPFQHLSEVSRQYGKVQERARYRFVYGKQSLITAEMIQNSLENVVFEFPAEVSKRLEESIKSSDAKVFESQLAELTQYIGHLHHNNFVYMLLHIISIINYAIRDINQNGLLAIDIDLKSYYHLVMEQETWEEVQTTLTTLFTMIASSRKDNATGHTNAILVDTIKDMIDDRYSDSNLSLQMIASILKMSTAHISKLFREKENKPISEYITDVRLNNARVLLETSDYTVNDIMERVGFNNQSYFFRLFKKKYGVTPKELRTKKVIIE